MEHSRTPVDEKAQIADLESTGPRGLRVRRQSFVRLRDSIGPACSEAGIRVSLEAGQADEPSKDSRLSPSPVDGYLIRQLNGKTTTAQSRASTS